MSQIFIETRCVGKWKENSYLLHDGEEGWLIDPGDDYEALMEAFCKTGLHLKGILCTHGHFDHIGAVAQFQEQHSLPFYIHSKDKTLVRQGNLYRKLANGNLAKTPMLDRFLDDVKALTLGTHSIAVFHTPGHTNGSVSFVLEKNLFAGDLILQGHVGRTDLPGGNKALLQQSLQMVTELFAGYTVYPGHGEPFILNQEAILNAVVKEEEC